jgi:hypothetical protein
LAKEITRLATESGWQIARAILPFLHLSGKQNIEIVVKWNDLPQENKEKAAHE